MNLLLILKSEKFFNSSMFSDNQKKLCLFIIKFHLKLERNADQFLTDADKISYEISQLKKNAAVTINFFY